MENKQEIVVCWFRRDLRLEDNIAFCRALESGYAVLPLFIFDTTILRQFEDKADRRVDYIHQALASMNVQLQAYGSSMYVPHNTVEQVYSQLLETYSVKAVFCNEDYEPAAIQRDTMVGKLLGAHGIPLYSFTDQVVFAKYDILNKEGLPYKVYTPYSKMWRSKLTTISLSHFDFQYDLNRCYKHVFELPSLTSLGFERTAIQFSKPNLEHLDIVRYGEVRDYPALDATTRIGIALRFGTVSIRQCVRFAMQHNDVWLSELMWREFFMQVLYHFPHSATGCFKPQYENIQWRNNEQEFDLWCKGETGYPIVDAGMRELNTTGYMHNRVRMIVASFLTKHLLIDWRWGEAYFAQKLDDYDLSANIGNWQWAAGSGCDAAPYFRVFNPSEQHKKFDSKGEYVQKWVPEYQSFGYCLPIVEHKFARERAIETYKIGLTNI